MSRPDKPKTFDGFIELVRSLDVPEDFMTDRNPGDDPRPAPFDESKDNPDAPDAAAAVDEMLAFMRARQNVGDVDLKSLIDEGRL